MIENRDKSGVTKGSGGTIEVHGIAVAGKLVDALGRCEHYHSPLDIISIKFHCCQTYYPCHSCHEETAGHVSTVWPKNEFNQKAVLCGACGLEMSITEYMGSSNQCPSCHSLFNPGCANHYHLYFEV